MSFAYNMGMALGKAANTAAMQSGAPPIMGLPQVPSPQSMLPGSVPVSPLGAGAAQPAIQQPVPAGSGNQPMPAGGGQAMQQLPQNLMTGVIGKRAADYQIPGTLGSFESSTFTPEAQGQRGDVPQDSGTLAVGPKPKRPKQMNRGGSLLSRMVSSRA